MSCNGVALQGDPKSRVAPGGFRFEECTRPLESAQGWTKASSKVPDVLMHWVAACRGDADFFDGAPALIGARVVRVLDAMHRSARSRRAEYCG